MPEKDSNAQLTEGHQPFCFIIFPNLDNFLFQDNIQPPLPFPTNCLWTKTTVGLETEALTR